MADIHHSSRLRYASTMPVAGPPELVAPIEAEDALFIKETVRQFFGPDAVVRIYGPDRDHLKLHVETSTEPGMKQYDCAGVLLARLDRRQIDFLATKRGTKPRAEAKIAFRQGVIL